MKFQYFSVDDLFQQNRNCMERNLYHPEKFHYYDTMKFQLTVFLLRRDFFRSLAIPFQQVLLFIACKLNKENAEPGLTELLCMRRKKKNEKEDTF